MSETVQAFGVKRSEKHKWGVMKREKGEKMKSVVLLVRSTVQSDYFLVIDCGGTGCNVAGKLRWGGA